MVRNITSVFLLSLFLFGMLYNSVIWVHYELNKAQITDEFCINIDKPELNCFGQCHIKRKLIFTEDAPTDEPLQAPSYVPTQENFVLNLELRDCQATDYLLDSSEIIYVESGWTQIDLNPPFKPPIYSV